MRLLAAFIMLLSPALAGEHTITLDDSELAIVSEALVAQPYSKVVQLIAKLQQQLQKERDNAQKPADGSPPLVSSK